jgi:hypothetical protein
MSDGSIRQFQVWLGETIPIPYTLYNYTWKRRVGNRERRYQTGWGNQMYDDQLAMLGDQGTEY